MDFPMQCGGFPLEHCGDGDWWESNPVPNDSTAVLQSARPYVTVT